MDNQTTLVRKPNRIKKKFQNFADRVNGIVGSPFWFAFSVAVVITWAFSGFLVGFTETWQLVINTFTTILTFLMISLLHSSQKKWEEKIERLQDREATIMKNIQKDTKRISYEKPTNSDSEVI